MAELIGAAEPTAGFYLSIFKLIPWLTFFFLWLPTINWVHRDTQAVRTDVALWTSLVVATGAVGLLLWLLIPMYIIGILLYVVAMAAVLLVYSVHRNSRVAEFEKILTPAHIKSLFVNEQKKISQSAKGINFITANDNEVPYPEPKSREAFGFAIACELFDDAIWKRAGEIILRPSQSEYSVHYLIDGVPMEQESREKEDVEFLIFYIKQLADLDVNEKRKPQSGPFKVERDEQRYEFEATAAGSTAGEQLVIRQQVEYTVMKIEDLGMTARQVEEVQSLREREKGVFLISGPKKSGLTSTFYALLRNHDPFMNNINTLEKKPAAELHNITQHTFNPGDTSAGGEKGPDGQPITYARRLQSILRMGPDIMGVGECEDKHSSYLCCKAANDSKIVYVTLHASGVMQALQQWIKLVEDRNLLAETLIGISNQRLVRILCEQCKQAYQPNPDLLRKFNLPVDKIQVLYRPEGYLYDKKGRASLCDHCQGTGYYGRTGIFEMILITDELRKVLAEAKSIQDIANSFRRSGMLYMQEQSLKKVVNGVTAINEVVREFTPQNSKKSAEKAS